jgi:hypothetical protein
MREHTCALSTERRTHVESRNSSPAPGCPALAFTGVPRPFASLPPVCDPSLVIDALDTRWSMILRTTTWGCPNQSLRWLSTARGFGPEISVDT